ncbi:hypothetical protein OQA88_9486 [Cercophora sp. LCS_1]
MDTTAVIATDVSRGRFRFLSFPREIRDTIYELALIYPDGLISTGYRCRPFRAGMLSAKLLRTCKQIHDEGVPILYGQNTFEIQISNTWGPHHSTVYYAPGLAFSNEAAVRRVRRVSIKVRYTECHVMPLIRRAVREIVSKGLLRMPRIDFLQLECNLRCGNENSDIMWRDACWDDYSPRGDADECARVLRTWLGLCQGVKEVVIKGTPDSMEEMGDEDAEILTKRLLAPSDDKSDDIVQLHRMKEMYEALEKHVSGMPVCEEDLDGALSAFEEDDVDTFMECKANILENVKKSWEALKKEAVLWEENTSA